MKVQVFMLPTNLEGVKENIEIGFPGEEGEPFDRCAVDEVWDAWFSDGLAAAHGSRGDKVAKRSFAGKGRSQAGAWERDFFRLTYFT